MKLSLGFSPCPNDTFIFEAMVQNRIDTEGIEYEWYLADVEELNQRALSGTVDITKMSYHAYASAADNYLILDSGSALGRNNGPLVVSRHKIFPDELKDAMIAIPGKYTTANLLFSIFWPDSIRKREYLFSDIPEAILSGEVDAGLIIHETRFTYKTLGLKEVADTGKLWDQLTGMPIPLGGIVIHRRLSEDIALKVNRTIRRSLEHAFKNPADSFDFIKRNATEISSEVMKEHIRLYVNEFTLSLGAEGRAAVNKIYAVAAEKNIINPVPERIFLIS